MKKFKYGIVTEALAAISGAMPIPIIDVFQTRKQRDAEYARLIKHYKTTKLSMHIYKIKICETTFI